jgi:hypothetical protein
MDKMSRFDGALPYMPKRLKLAKSKVVQYSSFLKDTPMPYTRHLYPNTGGALQLIHDAINH